MPLQSVHSCLRCDLCVASDHIGATIKKFMLACTTFRRKKAKGWSATKSTSEAHRRACKTHAPSSQCASTVPLLSTFTMHWWTTQMTRLRTFPAKDSSRNVRRLKLGIFRSTTLPRVVPGLRHDRQMQECALAGVEIDVHRELWPATRVVRSLQSES